MPNRTPWIIASLLAALLAAPNVFAAATPPLTTEKPFIIPTPNAAPKNSANGGIPQELVDLRNKIRDDFNALNKEAETIQAECNAARTELGRGECNRKRQVWQNKMDAVYARMSGMNDKFDAWHRQQQGLSPWSPDDQSSGSGGTSTYGAPAPKPPLTSPLLPSSSTPLPPGTF